MSGIIKFFKSIVVAFSIYSKIPMPRFRWGSDDMKYHLCFFPWIGFVIGALEWGLYLAGKAVSLPQMSYLCIAIAIPLLVTGGFHVDGFMDTMDALHSYQDHQKKLEILKDPHIGAFSVICLVSYLLILMGALTVVEGERNILCLCLMFGVSRCLSGLSVLYLPAAKREGMLGTFSSTAQKNIVGVVLVIELTACIFLWFVWNLKLGILLVTAYGLTYLFFALHSRKQFGGITGDLCGYLVTILELAGVLVTGIYCLLIKGGITWI